MMTLPYNIYIYEQANYFMTADDYVNIHQVWLDMALTKQQVEQAIAQYITDIYGDTHQYRYKYELIHQ